MRNASEKLAIAMRHGSSALEEIHEAMLYSRGAVGLLRRDDWNRLPQHIEAFREHTRQLHELWPHVMISIKEELEPSLSAHFHTSGGVIPQIGFWIARITRIEHLPTIRLNAWRQISALIVDICTALDPLPALFHKVEAYTLGLAARVEVFFMTSSTGPKVEDLESLKPALSELYLAWSGIRTLSGGATFGMEDVMKSPRFLSRSAQFWHVSLVLSCA